MMLRIALLSCIALCLAMIPQRAHAATTCSATAQNIVFGGYDGSTQATASGNISVNCSTDAASGSSSRQAQISMCVYLGNVPRTLSNGSSTLTYDLLKSDGTSWGSTSPAPPSQIFPIQYFFSGSNPAGQGSITIPVQATLPAQPGVGSGTYQQSYSGPPRAWIEYAANQSNNGGNPGFPACNSTGANDGHSVIPLNFNVSVTTTPACKINTATDLDFGVVDGLMTAPVDQKSLVTLNCVSPTAWTIGLDNGQNFSGTRRMSDGAGNLVAYDLYRDNARSQRWGNTINTDTQSGTGTGTDQAVTVYGRVPVQNATPGTYQDTITVTVTY